MADPSSWYARRLGNNQPRQPSTPPIYPGQPDTRVQQQPQTQLQRAQQIQQSQQDAAQELLSEARSGSVRQGLMADLASHYQGSRQADNGTSECPECGERRLIKPGATYMPRCYHCGWNPRFTVYG